METKRNHTVDLYVGTVPNSKLKSRKRGEMDTSYTYIDNRSDLYIIREKKINLLGNGFLCKKSSESNASTRNLSVSTNKMISLNLFYISTMGPELWSFSGVTGDLKYDQ